MASAPIKYIGRSARNYYGKTLFEILCQLKDFGVGRMVIRESFSKKYPEPTYYVVKKAVPALADNTRRSGYAMMDVTFRSVNVGVKKITAGYKPDWRLVHKSEEEAIQKYDGPPRVKRVAPAYSKFPPLMEKIILRDLAKQGHTVTQVPLLKKVLKTGDFNYCIHDPELIEVVEKP